MVGRAALLMLGVLLMPNVPAARAGVLSGVVTGDVDHLPWRKGKRTLGWVSVRAWRGGKLVRVARTEIDGSFALKLPRGAYQVEITRPAFLPHREAVTVPGAGEADCSAHLAPDPDFGLIVEPRAGLSAFCLTGGTFEIECAAPPLARGWSARLLTDYLSVPLAVKQARFGEEMVWNGTRQGWKLTVQVPTGTMPEAYHLEVAYRVAGTTPWTRLRRDGGGTEHSSEQPRAVCVRESWPEKFRLLMHLDFHFSYLARKKGAEGEAQAEYFRSAALLGALGVSLGDDIGFDGAAADDTVAMFWHMLRHDCRAPVFLAFGNHDMSIPEAAHRYYFGPHVQTRRMGPAVAVVRSFDAYQHMPGGEGWLMSGEQKTRVEAALAAAADDARRRVIFLAGHQARWKPRGRNFELPPSMRSFVGFNKVTGAREKSFERLFLKSFSVMSMHGWCGPAYTARVVSVDLEPGKVRVSPEVILPSVTYSPANNGTSPTVTALVKARGATRPAKEYLGVSEYFTQPPASTEEMIPYDDLTDLSLRFVMPRGGDNVVDPTAPRGRYRADKGRITHQVDAGEVTLVNVRVDMRGEEMSVTVSPSRGRRARTEVGGR